MQPKSSANMGFFSFITERRKADDPLRRPAFDTSTLRNRPALHSVKQICRSSFRIRLELERFLNITACIPSQCGREYALRATFGNIVFRIRTGHTSEGGGWRHSEAMSQDTVDRMNSAAVRPALKAQDAMETESLSVHSSELTAGEGLKKDTSWSRIRSHP